MSTGVVTIEALEAEKSRLLGKAWSSKLTKADKRKLKGISKILDHAAAEFPSRFLSSW